MEKVPETGNAPIVADMSSDIASRPVEVKKYGMIFAGAQKNLGPSGTTIVIVRKDLAERADKNLPTLLQYRTHIKEKSLYHTPPTFAIYIVGLVLEWIEAEGGIPAITKRNDAKAKLLYDTIEGDGFYSCPVERESRSKMNVVFRVAGGDEAIEKQFAKESAAAGTCRYARPPQCRRYARFSIQRRHPRSGAGADHVHARIPTHPRLESPLAGRLTDETDYFRMGPPMSSRNPMADWQMREKRPLRGPRPEPAGPTVKNYITPAGLQRLKDEHVFLLRRERPAVVEVVAWAASNGDRSENADYLYGKRRLGQIDSRIRFLTKRIDAAVVVDPAAPRAGSAATRVFFGATVTYQDAAGLEHVVSIVGIDEVDLDRGYISWRSPLGNALMKASPGDRVELRAPAKTENLEIIDVEYAPIPMEPFREPLGAQSTPKVERS